MSVEFVKNCQKFGIKKSIDPICPYEATVKFDNPKEMQGFFNNAMKDRVNAHAIQRIADGIAPSFIRRSLKSPPPLTESERLSFLFSEISKDNARVVLQNNNLRLQPESKDETN